PRADNASGRGDGFACRCWLNSGGRQAPEWRLLLVGSRSSLLPHRKPRQAAEPTHDVLDRRDATSNAHLCLARYEHLTTQAALGGHSRILAQATKQSLWPLSRTAVARRAGYRSD